MNRVSEEKTTDTEDDGVRRRQKTGREVDRRRSWRARNEQAQGWEVAGASMREMGGINEDKEMANFRKASKAECTRTHQDNLLDFIS